MLDGLECGLLVQGVQERILGQGQIQELLVPEQGSLEETQLEDKVKEIQVQACLAFLEQGILALVLEKILEEMLQEEQDREEGNLQGVAQSRQEEEHRQEGTHQAVENHQEGSLQEAYYQGVGSFRGVQGEEMTFIY